ncbi:type VII secretion-associated serine protease mycosin [Streptomyces sp. NPDC001262]|uniref:type VII secretion-associated serine protease mycosin n=1 Tax=unclassified Streptomyces TaxID=2593676 RepID=UPI0036CDA2CA
MLSITMRRTRSWLVAGTALLFVGVVGAQAQADTIRSKEWYLDAMHAEEMWKTSTGSGVTVAVIDSGVDADLPDLRGQVLDGKDFSGLPGNAHTDTSGHGSQMALFVAGTGKGAGTLGLAPGARILPVRALGSDIFKTDSALASSIRYAADSDAKIINMSLGSPTYNPAVAEAVKYALGKGKLLFASVGNTGDKGNLVEYPAAYPGVVGVAAVDREIKAASWSQSGPEVDLAAPGTEMVAPCADGTSDVCIVKGTSGASAIAAASAALIWSAHPNWTGNQVLRVLINTAGGPKSGEKRSDTLGYGVVRPRIALQNPGDPGPPDVSPLPDASAVIPGTSAGGAKHERSAAANGSEDDGLLSRRNLLAAGIAVAAALAIAGSVLIARNRKPRS